MSRRVHDSAHAPSVLRVPEHNTKSFTPFFTFRQSSPRNRLTHAHRGISHAVIASTTPDRRLLNGGPPR